VRNSRLVLVLFLSVVVCSGLLAAVGLRSLAADTARVDARYREQASGALAAVRGALASVLEEVRRGSAPALAVHVAADGALLEPAPELPPEVESSVPRDRVLYRFTSDEIDRLEREGNDAEARARLRTVAARDDDRWMAAWSLSTLAAIEKRAGELPSAIADWRTLADHFAGVRDDRGLDRALAARYEIAQCEILSDEPVVFGPDKLPLELDLYGDLISACARDESAAVWALKARVAEEARAELATSARDAATEKLRARFQDLVERDHQSELAAGVATALAQDASARPESISGGAEIVPLPRSPLADPAVAPRRALVALRREEDGTWRGGALELERVAEIALARPEIAAYAALGIATSVSSADGPTLAVAGSAKEGLRGDPLVADVAAPPFDGLKLAAFGLDRAGFLARERSRFVLFGVLCALALVVASIAGLATLRALKREVDATKSREAFVAAVTHELKAPLASIRLLAEVLGRGGVEDAKVREFATRTISESDRLTRLVDSILEWAKIEHGGRSAGARVDLNGIATRAAETFRPLARERGFDVELRVPASPTIVLGDADAIEGALLNLLDNALKYSDVPHAIEIELARSDGSARIESRDTPSAGGSLAHAELAVLDRGRGVPAEEAARIFEPFRRVGDELVRERPGVGLGLALVHKIALAHGGRATCTPREGGGSRFAIELPLAEDSG
jgi:signal transduction histidine kinase